eukprot:10201764-Alexandrium_andersonii.AAC.1
MVPWRAAGHNGAMTVRRISSRASCAHSLYSVRGSRSQRDCTRRQRACGSNSGASRWLPRPACAS